MKQLEIIQKLPAIFAKANTVEAAILEGSFGRKQAVLKSDVNILLLVNSEFNPSNLLSQLIEGLTDVIVTYNIITNNAVIVYFKDHPKLDLVWFNTISDWTVKIFDAEVNNIEHSILYQKENLEINSKALLSKGDNKSRLTVKQLTEKFIYDFENASQAHQRSDSYKSYFFYNQALQVLVQLYTLRRGLIEYKFPPKSFIAANLSKSEQSIFRNLSGSLRQWEINSKKRNLLDCFYKVILDFNIHTIEETEVIKRFLEHIYLRDFVWNFRDIAEINAGIKPGKIYRSSSLSRHQSEPFFRDFLVKKRITKVIDLRDENEYLSSPYSEMSLSLFEHLKLNIDQTSPLEGFGIDTESPNLISYRYFGEGHKHIYKRIFEEVDPDLDTIVIHCVAGKDRTGSVVALIARLCGESISNILDDYKASEMDTTEEKIHAFLELVDEYGGAYKFLKDCGITDERLQHWITALKKD